jgi:hypothetical protein
VVAMKFFDVFPHLGFDGIRNRLAIHDLGHAFDYRWLPEQASFARRRAERKLFQLAGDSRHNHLQFEHDVILHIETRFS